MKSKYLKTNINHTLKKIIVVNIYNVFKMYLKCIYLMYLKIKHYICNVI
jgi:hypothetical protein